jgi:hypothetical protein
LTPEQRKEYSELQLHKLGVRINLQLHVIEADEEVQLRSVDEVFGRLCALWAVYQIVEERDSEEMHAWLRSQSIDQYLSQTERAIVFGGTPDLLNKPGLLAVREALFFLAWSLGLVDTLKVSARASSSQKMNEVMQGSFSRFDEVRGKVRFRSKAVILDWSDLLYRLHWAMRHAQLTQRAYPPNVNLVAVQQWHKAVNWLCRYDDEDDWDRVSTET